MLRRWSRRLVKRRIVQWPLLRYGEKLVCFLENVERQTRLDSTDAAKRLLPP
jgi:hypothetical protein